jgi:hypothetical protein
MKLRTVTLVAGIAQLVTLLCGVLNYIWMLTNVSWEHNVLWHLTQPVYLLAHATLVVFLFSLVARQSKE